MISMPADTLDIALDCLKAHPNWYLFPIKRLEKYPPCFPNNLNLASNDPEQIRKWYKMYPGCNWGVALKKSKLIAVDVDRKPGKFGGKTLDALELERGILPDTFVVGTPTGGLHLYFNEANGVVHQMRLAAFGPDVDSTNYTLIPGCWLSSNAEQGYSIINDAPVADAPAWFADYLGERTVAVSDQTPVIEQDTSAIVRRAIDYLQNDAKPSIQFKNGEFTLLITAGVLKDMGISKETAIELLAKYYNVPGKCEPLWELNDGPVADRLDAKVANAWNYLKNTQPGALSPQAEFGAVNPDAAIDEESITRMLDVWKVTPGNPKKSEGKESAVKKEIEQAVREEMADALRSPPTPPEPLPEPWDNLDGDVESIPLDLDPEPVINLPLIALDKIDDSKKPASLKAVCQQWIWIVGIKRFVNRKNPTLQWDTKQFDSAFNQFTDKSSVSGDLFKNGILMRKFRTAAFRPGKKEFSGNEYNIWRSSGIEPVAGDTSVWNRHINYLFQNADSANRVLNWMAWVLQNPDKKPNHALLIVGKNTGTGKSIVATIFEQIIGERNTARPKNSSMGGDFNSWLKNCRLCILEEVYQPGRIEKLVSMRDLITEARVEINEKGIPAQTYDNYVAMMGISNHPDALPLDRYDRRWLVEETLASSASYDYYEPLYALARGQDKAGLSAIYAELLARDLGGYSGQDKAPLTKAKEEMIELSRDDAETWLIDNAGNVPLARNVVTVADVLSAMPGHMQRKGRLTTVTIPTFLRERLNGVRHPTQVRLSNTQQVYLWVLHGRYSMVKDQNLRAIYENELRKERVEVDASAKADFEEGYEEGQ